jgi:hypothetical protein
MGLTMQPAGPDKYTRGTGRDPSDGRWEPKKYFEQQAAERLQKEKAARDRKNIQKIMWAVGVVTFLSLIIPILLPGNVGCDPCFLTTFIVFLFIGIMLWVIYAAGGVGQAAQANLPYFYPVVDVRGNIVYLDGLPVDYSTVAQCQWDQVMDEVRIVGNDWRRKVIYLRSYESPEALAKALRRAFEANGIKVEVRTAEGFGTFVERRQALERPYGAPPQEVAKGPAAEEPGWAVEPVSEEEEYALKAERTVAEVVPEAPRQFKEPAPEPSKETVTVPGPVPVETVVQATDNVPRCRNCGAPLSEDLIECPNCGTAI